MIAHVVVAALITVAAVLIIRVGWVVTTDWANRDDLRTLRASERRLQRARHHAPGGGM